MARIPGDRRPGSSSAGLMVRRCSQALVVDEFGRMLRFAVRRQIIRQREYD